MDSIWVIATVIGVIFYLALVGLGIYFASIMGSGRQKTLSVVFAAFGILMPPLELVPISVGAAVEWK